MKKLFSALALTLGILAIAPSAFCSPKENPNTAKLTIDKEKKPKKEAEKSHKKSKYKKIVIKRELLSQTFLPATIDENYLFAPNADIVNFYALANQPNIEVVKLPKVRTIFPGAFMGCKNLKKIILGDDLQAASIGSFTECNPNLKIIYKGKKYSVIEFFEQNSWINPLSKSHQTLVSAANKNTPEPKAMPAPNFCKHISAKNSNPMNNFAVLPLVTPLQNLFPVLPQKIIAVPAKYFFTVKTKCKKSIAEEPTVIESSLEE